MYPNYNSEKRGKKQWHRDVKSYLIPSLAPFSGKRANLELIALRSVSAISDIVGTCNKKQCSFKIGSTSTYMLLFEIKTMNFRMIFIQFFVFCKVILWSKSTANWWRLLKHSKILHALMWLNELMTWPIRILLCDVFVLANQLQAKILLRLNLVPTCALSKRDTRSCIHPYMITLGTIQILRNQKNWVGGVGPMIMSYAKKLWFVNKDWLQGG